MLRLVRKVVTKTLTSRLGLFGTGAALMYYFDPDRGRSRRAQAASQAQGLARRQTRRALRDSMAEVRNLEGRMKGAAVRARGGGRFHPESDADLREHLTQVIRSLPVPTEGVTVDACAGKVTLRGQVESPEHKNRIEAAVSAVDGVDQVEDFLHLPGVDAPNKVSALRASHRSG